MKAVILAAGEGIRCRPLTSTRSKVMLPVANKPILEHVIESLAKNGIKDLILVVGYERERVMNYFEDGLDFGVNIRMPVSPEGEYIVNKSLSAFLIFDLDPLRTRRRGDYSKFF